MEIKVNKTELLGILHENRKQHRAVFEEAMTGYRKAAIAELDIMIQDARDGRKIRRHISLVEPTDQTADYDRIIRMLELHTSVEIELEENEFSMYVLDQWHWRGQFAASNSVYATSANAMAYLSKMP